MSDVQYFDALPQGTPEWFELRAGYPTASEFKRIVTTQGKFARDWLDFTDVVVADRIEPPSRRELERRSGQYMTPAMAYGHEMEPEARRAFEFETGLETHTCGFVLNWSLKAGGSPDALVGDDSGFETKALQPAAHHRILRQQKIPPGYLQQCHGHMAVTGRRSWWFMAYRPKWPHYLQRVEWDDYTDTLVACLEKFRDKCDELELEASNYE